MTGDCDTEDETNSILDQIAEEIGEVTESQDSDEDDEDVAREGEEFDVDDYKRNKNDYDGGW